MIYYRLALLKPRTMLWDWKTAILTSSLAVFHWLKIYSIFPQDQIRVFSSQDVSELEEMLRSENCGVPSGSVTAEQFLRERLIIKNEQLPVSFSIPPSDDSIHSVLFPQRKKEAKAILDKKRLELEWGPGGDHDIPYYYALPTSRPLMQAWLRLQEKHLSTESEEQA